LQHSLAAQVREKHSESSASYCGSGMMREREPMTDRLATQIRERENGSKRTQVVEWRWLDSAESSRLPVCRSTAARDEVVIRLTADDELATHT